MHQATIDAVYYDINAKYDSDFIKIFEIGEIEKINIREEEKQYYLNILEQLGFMMIFHSTMLFKEFRLKKNLISI